MLNPVSTAHLPYMGYQVPTFIDIAKTLETVIRFKVIKGVHKIVFLHRISWALDRAGSLGHFIKGIPDDPYCNTVKSFVQVVTDLPS
ncbi:hypothetical protein H0H81_002496 [Sphagnurus paluster]|uniref:Uncharacterized protein n=1 Tax=Sphagnurus paluster TaxID=117069 RepID=A0A9P7FRZ9_9AGAR|nr:hypothetical protein H0H81_002496 [Sphagnurus paluster]